VNTSSLTSSNARILLAALTFAAFAIGLDTFVVIGALAQIGRAFGISASAAGWIVSVYAMCYAVFAPLSAWIFRGRSRRGVVLMSLGAFALGNTICGISVGFTMLLAGRVISAFGAATFTPAATAAATELLPASRRGVALSIIFAGMTVSQAAGVPITTWIATAISWRFAFYGVTLCGVLAAALLFVVLQRSLTGHTSTSNEQAEWRSLPGRAAGLLSLTFITVLSEFSIYSYVSVLLDQTRVSGHPVLPMVLFAYGAGAVAGNLSTGVLTDRFGPTAVFLGAVTVQTGLLAGLVVCRSLGFLVVGIAFCWGIVSYMYLVPIQHRLLSHAGGASSLVLATNSSLIYAGIAAGAWLGGLALGCWGISSLLLVSSAVGAIAVIVGAVYLPAPLPESSKRG
jgi:MFS transporter, DHA1 family, inner membrane transport protein